MFGTGLLGPFGSRLQRLAQRATFSEGDLAAQPRRLHLGCGPKRAPGFCNVDITPQPSVDIIDNVATLERFPDNHAELIYACHVLEHFSHADACATLRNWHRVLRPGGELRISVPDIDRIVAIYSKNIDHFRTDGNAPWIGLIYGGQEDAYDFHKTGFNFTWMRHLLAGIGFVNIEEYPHTPHFVSDFKDASLSAAPFGEFISLNVRATKSS